jgi:hypothetical protein
MNNVTSIDSKIATLRQERNHTATYWFELGESDTPAESLRERSSGLAQRYPNNSWYVMGWCDRAYQIEIGLD